MLNPVSTEALLYSATYVDNYIDSVENLPDDVQRHLSRIRDIDVQYRSLLRDVDHYYDLWRSLQNNNGSEGNCTRRARAIARMQQSLIQAQELGDEKMQIVNLLQELIDHKTRQLDTDQKNLDIKEEMQQQQSRIDQLQQADDIVGPTPAKQARASSPTRDSNTFCANGGSSSGAGGGGSTPNSERSSHASNGTSGSGTVNGASNTGTGSIIESQRSATKRSRRRNESAVMNSNVEFGGNESNSANEGGGSNGGGANERQTGQKASGGSGAAQKKHNSQHQNASGSSGAGGGNTSGAGAGSGNNSGKKKKRKTRGGQSSAQASVREETPPPDPIDPDEPTYCVCNQISFGEMILCDNDLCPIEWFHFSCVSLVLKPKGKWFCPNCRGDRPNVMKPKAQFLKELERYNKEKEEKT
ncbi:PREDICTED: inhibitor of growth protein 1 [Bactrocera latifrons]|uniref:Inhibitor of growth protein n=1 Tax=Bactrocera latifrons TaxID=174628 RepID=A0A0K8VG69_BACLA|nr:PREDICTED: inhibitor of growth protein 1 [Bactrocera latifrons]